VRASGSNEGSLTVVVLVSGTGGREAVMASAAVEMGSPLVCSMVVAMLRRSIWGAKLGAKRLVARRRAMLLWLCGWSGEWVGDGGGE
jgi:hypothetical protein